MRCADLALVLAVIAPACTGEVRSVDEVLSLCDVVPLGRRLADPELREPVQDAACADEALVLRFGEPIAFERLDLPPTSRLGFELGGVRGAEERLSVVLRARLAGGREARVESELALDEGGGVVRFEQALAFDERVLSLELTLASPVRADGSAVLLRPRVTWSGTIPVSDTPRRQVLFVTLDTLRADHLGCYGAVDVETPALDSLAAGGVRFEDAVTAANVTNPSHASMFTGLHVKDHGVHNNQQRFDVAIPTLPRVLAREGFRTAGFAGVSFFGADGSNLGRLFDVFEDCSIHEQRRAEDVNADVVPWLNAHADEDFFAWVHYFDAHWPYVPPEPWGTAPPAIEHTGVFDADRLEPLKRLYRGEVGYLDHQLGVLLEHLRRLGIFEQALIVVVADHGESLGEHGIPFAHHGLFDATVKVPLIVKPSGGRERGGVVSGAVSTVDLFPTVLDLLGIESGAAVRGRSLRGAIETALESGSAVVEPRPAYVEHTHRQAVAVRTASYKLVLGRIDREYLPTFAIRAGELELYARADDPRELLDVSVEEGATTTALRALLDEFLSESFGHTASEITDDDYVEALRKIGYGE